MRPFTCRIPVGMLVLSLALILTLSEAKAQLGLLDPTTIPKYVTPLIIPPVMPNNGQANSYAIAVRQFKQQILPTGYPPTTVWSYGSAGDPLPAVKAPDPASSFNYPAYTVETTSGTPVSVRWINDLKDPATGKYLPHLFTVDQTLHWANPPATGCMHDHQGTDCTTANPAPYTGPVPLITHVHGAHVDPHSDGFPEAWYLPVANDIPPGYAMKGRLFDDVSGKNPGNLGYADFYYRQTQPAATLWYHDHTIGLTRLNVYAGPAGFWLIRGGAHDGTNNGGVLPGPAPKPGDGVLPLNTPGDPLRKSIREIPIVIQDRSFYADGSLAYPKTRAELDGYNGLTIPDTDISPFWNMEAFFNAMVVNGTTWPVLQVARSLYRFRFLNGCNSRFLNLALFMVDPATGNLTTTELPFYQIGAEQGFLPKVVKIQTGSATELPGDGTIPATLSALNPEQALLMTLAERADVLVDFRQIPNGTRVRLINTGPDEHFVGFPLTPANISNPNTTGQVLEFVIDDTITGASPTDPTGATPATDPWGLVLSFEGGLGPRVGARNVALKEEASSRVCVIHDMNPGNPPTFISYLPAGLTEDQVMSECAKLGARPLEMKAVKLGTVDLSNPALPKGVPLLWNDPRGMTETVTLQSGAQIPVTVTENPTVGAIEEWDLYNFTSDAHPIHLHLVRFQVMERSPIPGMSSASLTESVQPWEKGFKDTVIAYPGMITKVKAKFDIAGLYVWHCHIVEHEDNEMMRPFFVSNVQIYLPLILALNTAP